jgi:hypothetical protein
MAYLGNDLQVAFPSYRLIDDISASFNGVLTTFALTIGGASPVPFPINPQQCLISVNGTIQKPDPTGTAGFTLTGTNIVFASAPTGGWAFFGVILAGADYVNIGANFPDGQVNAPSITFDQDTDTGFYRSGSGAVSFTSNGVGTATFGSASFIAPSFIPTSSTVPTNGVYLPAANSVAISTNSTERTRIDSSGRLLVGTSTSLSSYGINGLLNVASNGLLTRDASFSYFKNDIYGPILTLAKSRSDSIGTFTYPTSGDLLGTLAFSGAHTGNGRFDLGVRIDGYANQTWTSTALGSYLTFSTTADGASSPTERMRINANGNVLINTTTEGAGIGFNTKFVVETGGADTAVIKNSAGAGANCLYAWNAGTSGNNAFIGFGTEGSYTSRGSINYNRGGGVVAYNITSDYRAKTILGPLANTGSTIDALQVYNGVMNGATVERPMLVAHEAQEVASYCVTGEKDAVDADGNPIYQQMDHQVLVPLLIAEIQSLRQRVAALEAQ